MTEAMHLPRIVLGGVSSGVGKTTLTVAILAALRSRGLRVVAYKVGPDYLDPGYHRMASGMTCHNLDGWMMGRDAVLKTLARTGQGADIALVEGVMGLFDGASPSSEAGSTAEIAKWIMAPTVLVVDAGGMARTFGALLRGMAGFDSDLHLAGSLANRVGSPGHLDLLRSASAGGPPVLGGFPKNVEVRFPERHLGLCRADDESLSKAKLAALAELAEEWIDLDALLALAREAPALNPIEGGPRGSGNARARCRIGIARDEAFHFYYEENLRLLEEAGAELVEFSPLEQQALPAVDGLYLGGGYPELFASQLSANEGMRSRVRDFAASGRPIYAECGGMMYLQSSLRTLDGVEHAMTGLFDGKAVMQSKRVALGYVEVELSEACILGGKGTRFRGHQFRYSDCLLYTSPSPRDLSTSRMPSSA